jgi:hypothetical protein
MNICGKIATFAKPQNVMGNGRTTEQRQKFELKMNRQNANASQN